MHLIRLPSLLRVVAVTLPVLLFSLGAFGCGGDDGKGDEATAADEVVFTDDSTCDEFVDYKTDQAEAPEEQVRYLESREDWVAVRPTEGDFADNEWIAAFILACAEQLVKGAAQDPGYEPRLGEVKP